MNDPTQQNNDELNYQNETNNASENKKTSVAFDKKKKITATIILLISLLLMITLINSSSSEKIVNPSHNEKTQEQKIEIKIVNKDLEQTSNDSKNEVINNLDENNELELDIEKEISLKDSSSSNKVKTVNKIEPPEILEHATELEVNKVEYKERVEIPSEVIDGITAEILKQEKLKEANTIINNNINAIKNINEQILDKELPSTNYTIQLTASTSYDGVMLFVKKNNVFNYKIYETVKDNKPWFVLIKGNFLKREDALRAAEILPDVLKESTPWVKSGAQVNKEKSAK